jgi:hypothetical protein
MNTKTNFLKNTKFILFLFPLVIFSQSSKIETLKKKYIFNQNKSGYILLADKDNYNEIKIANSKGEIIYNHEKEDAFFGKLECNKFFTATQIKDGNDGGGYTTVDYVNVKLFDVTDIKNYTNLNYNLLPNASSDKINVYRILDGNNNVGLINSCGEVLIKPTYKRINNFNNDGLAVALSANELLVIDTLGNQILKRTFKHGIKSFPVRISMKSSSIWSDIIDNRIIASTDGKLFGVYDLKIDKILIPFSYDAIYNYTDYSRSLLTDNFYVLVKNNKKSLLVYKTLKEILPLSENADSITDIFEFENKYLVFYSKQIKPSLYNCNVFYDGKNLFDDNLSIKDVKRWDSQFILLHLNNGESMIYNLKTNKFISVFKNDFVDLENISETNPYAISKNMKNQYKSFTKHLQVKVPCGENCFKSLLVDDNGKVKTKPGSNSSYTIIQIDKEKDLFFYLVFNKQSYSLYNNDGKLILENFKIGDNEKDFAYFVKNNVFILNEDMENGLVYGKTAFDIDGNMIGERYKYFSEPSIVKELKNVKSAEIIEAEKTNRFLKKIN